jgi:antitoxin component YwqK of YwqJK toxin-antitoxin module
MVGLIFLSGQIMQKLINQRDSQGRKQGPWVETCLHDFTWKGHYKDGLREGLWEVYLGNGTLSRRRHYHHNQWHGLWEGYRENGTFWGRYHYHHGQEHGVWKDYWPDGTLQWRCHWHHGRLKGIEKWWNPQGVIIEKRYHLVLR